MELRDIKPTAKVEFETESGTLKFEVEYMARDRLQLDYMDRGRVSDRMRAALADAVVGWNLAHDDGTPWPCDAKHKALLLPQLVTTPVKEKTAADGKVLVPDGFILGLALLGFAQDPENFLKN